MFVSQFSASISQSFPSVLLATFGSFDYGSGVFARLDTSHATFTPTPTGTTITGPQGDAGRLVGPGAEPGARNERVLDRCGVRRASRSRPARRRACGRSSASARTSATAQDTLRQALRLLGDARRRSRSSAVSSAYESAPGRPVEQPPFLNAAARLETTLAPARRCWRVLLDVEARLGRVRDVRWGPRTCDLDLLLYGDATIDTPDLEVPHPRLAERRFVLEPLLELAPDARLPDGRALADLAPAVADQEVERRPASGYDGR